MSEQVEELPEPGALLLLLDERETLGAALERLVVTCRDAIPTCSDASVTLRNGRHKRTAAATSGRALDIDQWEYASDAGPCIDALRDGTEHYVADLDEAAVYAGFDDMLASVGVACTIGLPLMVGDEIVGALNVYADVPGAFDDEAYKETARRVAGQAAAAVHNLRLYDASRTLAEQLQQALESRAVIEQAKGVLVAQTGCSPEEAFGRLRDASQRENVKLREIAQRIVDSAAQRG